MKIDAINCLTQKKYRSIVVSAAFSTHIAYLHIVIYIDYCIRFHYFDNHQLDGYVKRHQMCVLVMADGYVVVRRHNRLGTHHSALYKKGVILWFNSVEFNLVLVYDKIEECVRNIEVV